MDKEDTVYVYNEILFNQEENFPFATTWIDLEGIMPSEINQTEKDKYCIVLFICEI